MTDSDDSEVKQLILELEQLQIQITRVNDRLRQLNNRTQPIHQTTRDKNVLSVGDTVEVTNKYKGQLGVHRTIIKITSAQVIIREANRTDTFRKYKANVKRVR